MSKKSYWLGALIIVIISALAIYFFLPSFGWQSTEVETLNNQDNQSNASTTPEKRINDKGQEWTLDDNADLIVSGGQGQKIRFLESQIYPLKVYPGDTQKMRIVVTGDYEISGVRAEIETDNGTKIMELTKTGTVAARDLNPLLAKYQVNDQHELVILSDEEALALRQQEISAEESGSLIKTARAAVGDKEVWEGSWTVQDTTHRDYRTKFIAYDIQGNENSLFLAWSDPCDFPNKAPSGKYIHYGDCTLSTTAGVEDGDFEMFPGSSVVLNTGGTLAYTPGKKILLPGGVISLSASNPSGGLRKGYLWAEDADSDGYAVGVNRLMTSDTNPPPGAPEYRRQNTLTGTELDCNDESGDVYPGQTQYFDYADSRGSFDYNCDGVSELKYNYVFQDVVIGDGSCEPYAGLVYDANQEDVTCTGIIIPQVPTTHAWLFTGGGINLPDCGSSEYLKVLDQDAGVCYNKEGTCVNMARSETYEIVTCR